MAVLIFIAHLPLLRMERQDDFAIGGGVLTRMPWPQFDALTQRAFTDWQAKYEQTEPVFFWYQEDLDLPLIQPGGVDGMEEAKTPMAGWTTLVPSLGYGIAGAFHASLVDPVWAALALAAPGGIAPAPRSSVTFVLPAGGDHHLAFSADRRTGGLRLQGDADMELAFLPSATGAPLSDEVLTRAADLVPVARAALPDPLVGQALRLLLDSAHVSLTPVDRVLLAVSALEDLLVADQSDAPAETMARRLGHLFGGDDVRIAGVRDAARALYRRRSALFHAEAAPHDVPDDAAVTAAQLLAGSIERAVVGRAGDVAAWHASVDAGSTEGPPLTLWPASDAPGRAPAYRLGPRRSWFAGTVSSDGMLGADSGTLVSWSPLVGLQPPATDITHRDLGVYLGGLTASAVVGMEEKDIRRDFVARVRLDAPVAALAVAGASGRDGVDEAAVLPLTRTRDLAVAGLRLAGFDGFTDPELLGWYVYDGHIRHRRETVLRQSVLLGIGAAPPVSIDEPAMARLQEIWSLLARYESDARHDGIDYLLDLYRRVHDRHFLDASTRAAMTAILLESLFGRFRSLDSPIRLEVLVPAIERVPADAAAWFVASGREFRNTVAHGDWHPAPLAAPESWTSDHVPLGHQIAIATAAVHDLLRLWIDADPPVRARHGPQGLLARTLGRRTGKRTT